MIKIPATRNQKGFTLIEMIASLAILGIIGIFGTMFFVNMVKSYQWAEDNAHLAQKAQVALTRIAVEMSYAVAVNENLMDNDIIAYDVIYPGEPPVTGNTIERNENNALIFSSNGASNILADRVEVFEVTPDNDNGYFTVRLTMTGANNVSKVFEQSIVLP